jgi:hypothetical protein
MSKLTDTTRGASYFSIKFLIGYIFCWSFLKDAKVSSSTEEAFIIGVYIIIFFVVCKLLDNLRRILFS